MSMAWIWFAYMYVKISDHFEKWHCNHFPIPNAFFAFPISRKSNRGYCWDNNNTFMATLGIFTKFLAIFDFSEGNNKSAFSWFCARKAVVAKSRQKHILQNIGKTFRKLVEILSIEDTAKNLVGKRPSWFHHERQGEQGGLLPADEPSLPSLESKWNFSRSKCVKIFIS